MDGHFAYCENLVRERDRDRFLATLFAPQSKRAALFAIYAYDIEIPHIADVVREPLAGEIRLQWWHDAISGQGHSGGSPVATALIETMRAFRLPEDLVLRPVEARQGTFDIPPAGPDEARLRARSQGAPIFELTSRILGEGHDADIVKLSAAAGTAFVLGRQMWNGDDDGAKLVQALLQEVGALLAGRPERLWPAFLPLALIRVDLQRRGRRTLPQWRRQLTLWRAARDLPKALA